MAGLIGICCKTHSCLLLQLFVLYLAQWVKDNFDCIWEVSTRTEKLKGFEVESKRWVVERTFAWIGKYRRLSKDYEFYENASESFIYMALIRKMLRNLTAINS